MNINKLILPVLFCFFMLPCYAAGAYKAQTDAAEENFKNGAYAKTIEIYESLVQIDKINDAGVYYNLANAYYRNGNLGRAVLNIEKAYRLKPRDKDIRHNYEFIRNIAGQDENNFHSSFGARVQGLMSVDESAVLSAVLFAFACLSFGIYFLSKKKIFRQAAFFAVLVLILSAAVLTLKIANEVIMKEAVVVVPSAVRSGPGGNNPEIFSVAEGKSVKVVSENNGWSGIETQNGPEVLGGWIESDKIGII